MTVISAVNIDGNKIILAADTHCKTQSGDIVQVSKILTLPHISTAIAGRGMLGFIGSVYSFLHASPATSFDEVADKLEPVMRVVFSQFRRAGFAKDVEPETLLKNEIVLAGYSDRIKRMCIRTAKSTDGGETIDSNFDVQSVVSPYFPGETLTEDIEPNADGLARLAELQIGGLRKHHPNAAAGGRLIVAEVRRNSINIETMGTLGNAG